LNKTERVAQLAAKSSLSQKQTASVLANFQEIVAEALAAEETVNLPDFGKF